ncbi:MAG: flagellin [Deltaproteobacteria bacterium]|nr:flagellin [Deltaproteobacteria bacterium]
MSDISLTSGMRQSLYSMQQTNQLMDRTASRLSSGYKVQTALDDPINYFAAQGHRQRASDLAGRKDEMGEAIQLIKAGNNGVEAVTDLVASAKSLAQSALSAEDADEFTALEEQYTEILSQIDELAGDSGYKGINLMGGTDEELEVAFDEDGDSVVTLNGFDGESTGLSLVVVGTGDWHTAGVADKTNIDSAITKLDDARTTLRTEAKTMANNLSTITIRQDFTSNMINTLNDGADLLTLADMNEEGANMLMLQTRQGLGTSSLSMASQAAQSVLRLF